METKYKSETSINKVLAELQMSSAAIQDDVDTAEEKSFESLLRKALQSENEAIAIYLELQEKAKFLGSKTLEKAFGELRKDETEHVGNLNFLLRTLCPEADKVEKEGETEEQKLQASNSDEG